MNSKRIRVSETLWRQSAQGVSKTLINDCEDLTRRLPSTSSNSLPNSGFQSFFEFLLKYGFDMMKNYESIERKSKDRLARNIKVLQILAESKIIDMNAPIFHGRTPLIQAIRSGDAFACRGFLELGANANCVGEAGDVPLCVAASNGNADIIKFLLDYGAKIKVNTPLCTPFLIACQHLRVEAAKVLLEYGAVATSKNRNGENALMHLAKGNCFELMDRLIELGIDVNSKNNQGETALFYSVRRESAETFVYLLKKGADIGIRNIYGKNVLMKSIFRRSNCIFDLLRKNSFDVNAHDANEDTLLMQAVRGKNIYATEVLIKCGADVNAENKKGMSPLWLAASLGLRISVKILLKSGAQINKQYTDAKSTPLLIAILNKKISMCHMLINNGADVNILADNGNSALYLAERNGFKKLAKKIRRFDKSSRTVG